MTSSIKQTTYTGAYVKDVIDVYLASAFSNVHGISISPPGWGKSEISNKLAGELAGADHYHLIPIAPTTSPSLIDGPMDNEILIKESRLVRKVERTPYDPNMRIVIMDELLRGSDPLFDAALHATDPLKQKNCVVWATSNFVPKGDRVQALLDRFGLWLWIRPDTFDIRALAMAQMLTDGEPQLPGTIPSWSDVMDVRSAKPGLKAAQAVADFLELLHEEAANLGLSVHPRQATHWRKLAYRMGVYHTGEADFKALPQEATRVIQWAWGSRSYEEAGEWRKLVGSMVDKVGATIDVVLANVVGEFKRVAAIASDIERTQEISGLGRTLAESQSDLRELGANDPRVKDAINLVSQWFADAINGKQPKLGGTE